MAINFNGAGPQGSGGSKTAPEDSIVRVKLNIREPKAGHISETHPLLTVPNSGKANHYLNCAFEITDGTYAGGKIYQNFVLAGSEKATNISMAAFRAIIEAVRHISPSDDSPNAAASRQVNDWSDFNGMEFPVKVGVEISQCGKYVNNNIKRVITMDDDGYEEVMAGGEIDSGKPLPTPPASGAAPSGGAQASTGNANGGQQAGGSGGPPVWAG